MIYVGKGKQGFKFGQDKISRKWRTIFSRFNTVKESNEKTGKYISYLNIYIT